jgi:hypothetical protein
MSTIHLRKLIAPLVPERSRSKRRTKVASKVYNMISNNGLVDIKKVDGDTYVTVTEKGDDVSEKLLRELIAYEEFVNMNKTDSDEPFKVKKRWKIRSYIRSSIATSRKKVG